MPRTLPHRPSLAAILALLLASVAAAGRADGKGDLTAVLAAARTAAARGASLQATLTITSRWRGKVSVETVPVLLRKPNYGRVVVNSGNLECLSDGATVWLISRSGRDYERSAAGAHFEPLSALTGPGVSPLSAFLDPASLKPGPADRASGTATVEGRTYQVVEWAARGFLQRPRTLYFGADGLLEGMELAEKGDGPYRFRLTDVRIGGPTAAEEFQFTPPAGYTERKPARPALGKAPPGLALTLLDGGRLALDRPAGGRKAVLVDFWYVGCSACRLQMPLLDQLSRALPAKGVEVVALNPIDGKPKIRAFLLETGFRFPVALAPGTEGDRIAKRFGVTGYPDTFLIAADGRILWRGSIADEGGLIRALQSLGVTE
jgi:thiol-disulfide isomerase/thioredoxin